LRYGNLNLVTLGLCLAAWRLRDRAPIAGFLLAAALGLKLLPLALVVFLLAAGRWRVVAWTAAFGLAAVALSWPWLGAAWSDYLRVLAAIGSGMPAPGSNVVPEALAGAPLRYLLPVLSLMVAALAGILARVRGQEGRAFTTALAAAPLLATSVWFPYLVMALPGILGTDGGPRHGEETGADRHDADGHAGGWRAASWLAIQAQLAGAARLLPLLGVLLLVAGGLRDILRRSTATSGGGHILGSPDH